MSRQTFIDELRALGHEPIDKGEGKICFPFLIAVGPRAPRTVQLGYLVNDDFPLNPPGGPHFSETLMPINTNGGDHPYASIHASPFGEGWQYWSRPIPHWQQTRRRVSDVLAHVHRLLDTLPP